MKKVFSGIIAALALVACGGSDNGNGKDLSKFLGSWSGNLTTTLTCPGNPPATGNSTTSVTLSNGNGSDLQYISTDGCYYKFNVSGSTASLVNAPVTCSGTTSSGTVISISITSYTLSTSDGHHLTANASGTASSGGTTCNMAVTGSGTR